jgi:hypothetical protein
MGTDKDGVDKLLEKIRKNLEMGRTAGREKLNGSVLFWSVAQSQTRGPLSPR